MLALAPTKTMSVHEFMENYRLKKEDYKENEIWESFANHIKSNKRLEKMFTFVVGSLMYCKEVYASVGGLQGIDALGGKLLSVCRKFAYWVGIIMCIVEIIKSLLQGDSKSIGKIIIKYILAFAAIYFVPWLFDLIKASF